MTNYFNLRSFRYFRPGSLTWWAGCALIGLGILQALGFPSAWAADAGGLTGVLHALTGALAALTGASGQEGSPAALIALGAALIGLRDAMVRDRAIAEQAAQGLARPLPPVQLDAYQHWGDDDEDDEFEADFVLPDGDSPLPPGVRDPWDEGGSRA